MATSEALKPPSSSYKFNIRYDIFLSCRYLNTTNNFIDHLYQALKLAGFQTIRGGDDRIESELKKVIRQARMSVIVISKDYAFSTVCLLETETILQRCKRSDHFLLPLFYHVDPSEVKDQARDLEELGINGEKGFKINKDKVKGWSAALMEVANIAGMVLQSQSDGYEAKFIEEIVEVLKSKLPGNHLRVADHLVSMDSRTKDVNIWLKDKSTRVGILVICGISGIGKTTIAKVVYNLNYSRFDATCFLPNIREVAEGPNGLVRLQRQLISDISRNKECKVYDVEDGMRKTRDVLANKRVLLVLDDVDDAAQLFSIVGQQDLFSLGSKIIITTRLVGMMKAEEIYEYRPEKLSLNESLELFSWHAFGQNHPVQGYMELSKKFVQHCDGHPLALRVLGSAEWQKRLVSGSAVSQKSLDVWGSTLRRLQATSDSTIVEKLEISFDFLKDNHDKNLFLDVACFFAGKKKHETITILEGCDYFAVAGIHNLVERNLLTIENEKLGMHQLIRDMAKKIVSRDSKYPEEHSRIWCQTESFKILTGKNATEKIEGIILDLAMLKTNFVRSSGPFLEFPGVSNSDVVVLETNAFEKMSNLRLLKLNGVQLSGTYEAFPKRLGWLYWRGFCSESFPIDFPLENLVVLDMRYSNLKQVLEGTKVIGSLKILNLSHSSQLAKTPDFSRIPNLEKLILKDCSSLVEVDESVVNLQRILLLNLQDCRSLRKLPRNIGVLKSLEEINISGCSNLMGPVEELVKMRSGGVVCGDTNQLLLREVASQILIWPRVRKSLSMPFFYFPTLKLHYSNLSHGSFPKDLRNLSMLQHLSLAGNPLSFLPDFISNLTPLHRLTLSTCRTLTRLPELPPAGISPLSSLSISIKNLLELQILDTLKPPKLRQIRRSSLAGVPPLSSLLSSIEVLVVSDCIRLEKITDETSYRQKSIRYADCVNLNYVQDGSKILAVGKVDVERVEVLMLSCIVWSRKASPIQILHKKYIFSTYFPGREVPHSLSYKNVGSTISFTMTFSPSLHFGGLNLCLVYTLPADIDDWLPESLLVEISNNRSGTKTVYTPSCYGIPETGGDMVWLSHWFERNLFKEGDEVQVRFEMNGDGQIEECGVQLLYFEEVGEILKYWSTKRNSNAFQFVPSAGFPTPYKRIISTPYLKSREEDLPSDGSEHLQLQVHQHCDATVSISDRASTSGTAVGGGVLSLEELLWLDKMGEEEVTQGQQLSREDKESLTRVTDEISHSCEEEVLEEILLEAEELEEIPPYPRELKQLNCDILRKLNLSYTEIKSLPQSISRLVALQELLLRSCKILMMELPPEVGELANLEVLDLEGTEILCLPMEIAKLVNLTCLKVSFYGYANQTVIPRRVLSNLSRLNELIMDVTPYGEWWDVEVRAIIDDLRSLKELRTLKLCLPSAELVEYLTSIFPGLANFRFTVGHHEEHFISRLPHDVEEEFNKLEKLEKGLKYVNGNCIPNEITKVFKHADAFFLQRHWTVESLSEFGHENMNEVKFCLVVECNECQSIIDSEQFYQGKDGSESEKVEDFDEAIVLESLEKLIICYMKNMVSFWKGRVGIGSMYNLKSLALHTCPNLTTLFTVDMLSNLIKLEELIVEDCPKLGSLVSIKRSDSKSGLFLPNLKKISLLELRELVSISSGLWIAPKLERMVIFYCPKLEKLSAMEVTSTELKVMKGEKEWWDSLKWYESDVSMEREDYLARHFIPLRRDGDLMAQLTED